jgi:hypothetical protein
MPGSKALWAIAFRQRFICSWRGPGSCRNSTTCPRPRKESVYRGNHVLAPRDRVLCEAAYHRRERLVTMSAGRRVDGHGRRRGWRCRRSQFEVLP